MSYGAGPTRICEHGYLDGLGCQDCDPPLEGRPVVGLLLGLGVLVAVVAVFLGGRWVVDRLGATGESGPSGVAGAWCGTGGEKLRVTLDQPDGRVLSGRLKMGRRVSTLTGRLDPGGLVALRTVGAALRFDLSGTLVDDRLRLNVVDDAGDTGRVELQRC